MSDLILPGRRCSQPAGAVEVDSRNPLARDLFSAFYPTGVGLSAGTPGVAGVAALHPLSNGVAATPHGLAYCPKNNGTYDGYGVDFSGAQSLTRNDLTVGIAMYDLPTFTGVEGDRLLRLGSGGGLDIVSGYLPKWVNGTSLTSSVALDAGRLNTISGAWRGTSADLVVNGALGATGSFPEFALSGALSTMGYHYGYGAVLGKFLLVAAWGRALSVAEQQEWHANPWQIFKPAGRVLYFDSAVAAGTHTLTGNSAAQPNASTGGGISQTHVLGGNPAAQDAASSAGWIGQAHELVGMPSAQNAASSAGAVGQVHVLAGPNASQPTAASAGPISQVHILSAADASQAATCTSGAVTTAGMLAGNNASQPSASTSGPIGQAHILQAAPVAADHVAAASAIVQTHLLAGASVSQALASTSGAIALGWVPPGGWAPVVGWTVASPGRDFAVASESRRDSIVVPVRRFTV